MKLINSKGNSYCIKSFHCGWGMHTGVSSYTFKGNQEECDLLYFILTNLGLKVTKIDSFSIKFSFKQKTYQRTAFKLCRYLRNPHTYIILTTIKKCIEKGVNPGNAVVLGHFYTSYIPYYNSSMDLIYNRDIICRGFNSLEEFISSFEYKIANGNINKVFRRKIESDKKNVTELINLMNLNKYIEAEKYILNE